MKKRIFADVIVCACLAVSLIITAAVIYEYHRLDTVIPAPVPTALIGFWGGELLILAARQVLGSDITKKDVTKNADTFEENKQPEVSGGVGGSGDGSVDGVWP